MNKKQICTFCTNKGIPGPHNHTVRLWTHPDKPIICPMLLANQCPFCKIFGHTKQYCPARKSINNANVNSNDDNSKRIIEHDDLPKSKIAKLI
tara:strand:+ start:9387 stop:9665 length:279 start_codon:yes stop_codon:yes gene_type:complete